MVTQADEDNSSDKCPFCTVIEIAYLNEARDNAVVILLSNVVTNNEAEIDDVTFVTAFYYSDASVTCSQENY